jgi:GNAT superfamily N-acetyltransferase
MDKLAVPARHALATNHTHFAIKQGGYIRYQPDIAFFTATTGEVEAAPDDLVALVRATGPVAFFQDEPVAVPDGLTITRLQDLIQMAAHDVKSVASDTPFAPLGDADADAMLALATLTEPGPFFARTRLMGDFVGIHQDGRLVAMAGERMRLPGFTEVSAVCTHPDARGRGYAAALTSFVAQRIIARGERPFLHVFPENVGAIRLYHSLGFEVARHKTLTVLAAV